MLLMVWFGVQTQRSSNWQACRRCPSAKAIRIPRCTARTELHTPRHSASGRNSHVTLSFTNGPTAPVRAATVCVACHSESYCCHRQIWPTPATVALKIPPARMASAASTPIRTAPRCLAANSTMHSTMRGVQRRRRRTHGWLAARRPWPVSLILHARGVLSSCRVGLC